MQGCLVLAVSWDTSSLVVTSNLISLTHIIDTSLYIFVYQGLNTVGLVLSDYLPVYAFKYDYICNFDSYQHYTCGC